jgi:hypothetical protein
VTATVNRRADELAADLVRRRGREIARMRRQAWTHPWEGRGMPPPIRTVLILDDPEKPISCLFTYDVGAHNCGWWRNSQYDRCWHLSLVVMKPGARVLEGAFETPTDVEWRAIAAAFFGPDVTRAWIEPPASAFDTYRTSPQSRHTYHVRVFTDREGHALTPEGEVYTLKPWEDGTSPAKVFRS